MSNYASSSFGVIVAFIHLSRGSFAGLRVGFHKPEPLVDCARDFCEHICRVGVLQGADGVVILTEWNEFRALDLARMKGLLKRPLMVDLRNIYRPEEMEAAGFVYESVGRPAGQV